MDEKEFNNTEFRAHMKCHLNGNDEYFIGGVDFEEDTVWIIKEPGDKGFWIRRELIQLIP